MSIRRLKHILVWLIPLMALTAASRPVVEANFAADLKAKQDAARKQSADDGNADDDASDAALIGLSAADPWDRVVRPPTTLQLLPVVSTYPPTPIVVQPAIDHAPPAPDAPPTPVFAQARLWPCGPPTLA